MPISVFGRRRLGDPWYTALYQDPARLWWLPGVLAGVGYASLLLLVGRRSWPVVALPAAIVAAFLLTGQYVSYRRDRR